MFNLVVFHVTFVSALDVRIETIEDDGTRDVWTFNNENLDSKLPYMLAFFFKCLNKYGYDFI